MKDILLDFQNKKLLNEYVDNQNRVAQQIKVIVRSWLGDFFLNANYGVNYDDCWGSPNLMKAYLEQQIKTVDGVVAVNSLTVERDRDSETKKVFFKFNGEIILDGSILTISDTIGDIYS